MVYAYTCFDWHFIKKLWVFFFFGGDGGGGGNEDPYNQPHTVI